MKYAIVVLLFFGKLCGKIVGVASRNQTRLLTWASDIGWKPTDEQSKKLLRRQQQLLQFELTRKSLKIRRNTNG